MSEHVAGEPHSVGVAHSPEERDQLADRSAFRLRATDVKGETREEFFETHLVPITPTSD